LPACEKEFFAVEATMEREITLTAPDISCGHCVATVQKAVGGLEGVSFVRASEATKQVVVRFDPAKVSLGQIETAMDEEGYPVAKVDA
jgi:copper ion binding protein